MSSEAISSLELLKLDHPGSPHLHHLRHSESVSFTNRVGHVVVGLMIVTVFVPLAISQSNCLQGSIERLVLLKVQLAVTVCIGVGPSLHHLRHLSILELFIIPELVEFLDTGSLLLGRGADLPLVVLLGGSCVDPFEEFCGECWCWFCHSEIFWLSLKLLIFDLIDTTTKDIHI